MQYQGVILNFDKKTVQYVEPRDVPTPKKAATAVTGSSPPSPRS